MSESESPKRGRKTSGASEPQAGGGEDRPGSTAPAPEGAEPPVRNPWLGESEPTAQRRSANIEDIFRQRGGGSGDGRGLPKGWLGWSLLGVVSAWLLFTSVHVLAQGERGILTTLGRYEATLGPGLNITMPWPFQQLTRRNVGEEMSTLLPDKDTETLMPTRDGELIDVRLQLRWRVTDLRAFSYALPDGEAAVRRLADSAVRAAIAETGFDDLREGKHRAELQQRVTTRIQRVLDAWHAGVRVVGAEITEARPPARLADTFKAITTADQEAAKNRQAAQTYAAQVTMNAQAEAAAFDRAYELYRIAPDVTRQRIYYETVEKVLRNNPVVIGNGGGSAGAPPIIDVKPVQGGR